MEAIGRLSERLDHLGVVLEERHINRYKPEIQSYDWEQVQQMELAEMLKNPPKES